jgi:uncharacterized protein
MASLANRLGVAICDVEPKGRGVVALRKFESGELVIVSRAIAVVAERSLYSVQVEMERHVLLDEPAVLTNHSCTPNTGVRNNAFGGYDFIALRRIKRGEEITWDYDTTEYETIGVQQCLCGATECRGRTRGFKYNAEYIRRRYAPYVADYLVRLQANGIPSSVAGAINAPRDLSGAERPPRSAAGPPGTRPRHFGNHG